jgi:hypothetical protein
VTNRYTCPGYGGEHLGLASSWTTKLALVITLCVLTTGCVAPKRAAFIVPRRCLKIDAESFTRPCVQRADGKIVCDGVVFTATCLQVSQ